MTGLRREQLYMWQRRYGFPSPLRDSFGDRVYPPDQVARLKLIKQLLSEGWRAGAVVPLAEPRCNRCWASRSRARTALPAEIETAVKLLSQHRVGELQNHLSKLLVGQGLRRFLEHDADPAERGGARARRPRRDAATSRSCASPTSRSGCCATSRGWSVRRATRGRSCWRRRRTIPNQLGLAILELLLFTEGVNCLTLGAGVPAQEIAGAANAYKVRLRRAAVRPRHFGQDRRARRSARCARASGDDAAGGQRPRGPPAREADRRRAHRRRLQLDHGDDARACACCRRRR